MPALFHFSGLCQIVSSLASCGKSEKVDSGAAKERSIEHGSSGKFVSLWRTTTSLGNSGIFQKGTRLGIGTKAPGAQLDIRALVLIPAFSALGASGPPGSDQNATAGISSRGGDADPDSGFSVGGAGVVVVVTSSILNCMERRRRRASSGRGIRLDACRCKSL